MFVPKPYKTNEDDEKKGEIENLIDRSKIKRHRIYTITEKPN